MQSFAKVTCRPLFTAERASYPPHLPRLVHGKLNLTFMDLAKAFFVKRGQQCPIVIQTMVPSIDGRNPFVEEIDAYIARLRDLNAGTQISLVQIYSANRPTPHSECGHLPLRALSEIAKRVQAATGLRTEVY